MGKMRVTPGKLTVTQARVGVVVVGLMLFWGLGFGLDVLSETPESEGGLKIMISLFFLVWAVACGAILLSFLRVARQRGSASPESFLDVEYQGADFDDRLRKLEILRREGLVTEDEYTVKRSEIMAEKW